MLGRWIFFILFIIQVGCGKVEREKILDIRLSSDLISLDPAMVVDVAGGTVLAKLYNGLVRYNERMEIVGDIAKGWDVSKDGRVYTFYLKEGIRFANNRELSAKDVKYSIERILNPKTRSPRQWVFDRIEGAKEFMGGECDDVSGIVIKDRYTIEIRLTEPFSPFLGLLTMPAGYIVPKEEVDRWGEAFGEHPCGTGPFKLVEWRRDEEILLRANLDYFDGPPRLDGIRYRIIPNDLTAVAEFLSGGLDVMGIPWAEFETFMDDPKLRPYIKSQAGLNVYYLGLNCQRPPFDNPRVRQALNYGINKELILKTLLKGRGILSHGPIPPTLLGYNPLLSPYPYDPDRARRLLREEGFGDGFSMKIYQKMSMEALSITQAIQGQLKEIGIDAEIIQLEWSAFKEAINKGEADAFYLAWVADYPDPENFLFPLFHSSNFGPGGNRARFKDNNVDSLISKAILTQDLDERIRLYQMIEKRIRDMAPWVFLWHLKEYVVHKPWVKGLKLYPIYNADKGKDVYIQY